MKAVVATALILVMLLFLGPVLLLRSEPLVPPTATPTATQTPAPAGPRALKSDKDTPVRVKLPDGSVTTLSMGDYLFRVVAAEMPATFAPEALKAQAVTARSYTLWKMARAVKNHPDADVCTDIRCCQAYVNPADAAANWGNAAPQYTKKLSDAVSSTDGRAILYDGKPIDAVFFSSAAGRTADAVEVWGGSLPYLTGVPSPEGEEVPNYHTSVTVPVGAFRTALLEKYPHADLTGAPSGWFQNSCLTSAGAVDSVEVGGVKLRGTELRALFGLRSASFTVAADGENVSFAVTGYGHGVGMSQYGANAMAGEGSGYEEILKHYYTGVTIGIPQA